MKKGTHQLCDDTSTVQRKREEQEQKQQHQYPTQKVLEATSRECKGGSVLSRLNVSHPRRQGDKETGRQGDREIGRQGHRETGIQGDKETGRQGDRDTGRQGDRETGRQGGRETGRQGGWETGRQGFRPSRYWNQCLGRSFVSASSPLSSRAVSPKSSGQRRFCDGSFTLIA